jgi:hypothetical protein
MTKPKIALASYAASMPRDSSTLSGASDRVKMSVIC